MWGSFPNKKFRFRPAVWYDKACQWTTKSQHPIVYKLIYFVWTFFPTKDFNSFFPFVNEYHRPEAARKPLKRAVHTNHDSSCMYIISTCLARTCARVAAGVINVTWNVCVCVCACVIHFVLVHPRRGYIAI